MNITHKTKEGEVIDITDHLPTPNGVPKVTQKNIRRAFRKAGRSDVIEDYIDSTKQERSFPLKGWYVGPTKNPRTLFNNKKSRQ